MDVRSPGVCEKEKYGGGEGWGGSNSIASPTIAA